MHDHSACKGDIVVVIKLFSEDLRLIVVTPLYLSRLYKFIRHVNRGCWTHRFRHIQISIHSPWYRISAQPYPKRRGYGKPHYYLKLGPTGLVECCKILAINV